MSHYEPMNEEKARQVMRECPNVLAVHWREGDKWKRLDYRPGMFDKPVPADDHEAGYFARYFGYADEDAPEVGRYD